MDVMEKSRRAHFLFDQTPENGPSLNDQHNSDDGTDSGSGGVCVSCCGGIGVPKPPKSSSTAKDVAGAGPAGSNRT